MFDVEKIRADFPLLSTEVYGRPLVYLDSGATAQKPRCVIDTVDYLHRELNANIHRGVHRLAEEATERYEAARDRIRAFIGAAHREEVIFTAGATASLNTVAYAWGDTFLREGDNIVVSEMEHHSNLVPWQAVALRKGAELRMLPFDDAGRLMTERLDGLIDGRTRMVAVTQASNTLGTRPDLRPIVEAAHAVGALVCVDGCQGIVHGGADVAALGCDFYAFSGHKLYGPTGIGVLYGRRELLDAMPPYRSATRRRPKAVRRHSSATPVRKSLSRPDRTVPGNGSPRPARSPRRNWPCPLRISAAYDVGMILDKLGIAVRTGQHCAEPVMTHYGVPGMCRASLAMYNTRGEIDALAAGVERAVRMLR